MTEQSEQDKDILNIETYMQINRRYSVRLTGPLIAAFKTPAEYEDFIRRIDKHLRDKLRENNK